MKTYLDALGQILSKGESKVDRTQTGTMEIFGMQQRYDLRDGFPAVTTKKLAWNAVVSELLWFIEGSTDERRLAEILHGTRDPEKKTVWTANAQAEYWKPRAGYDGDCGNIYGYQWRNWGPRLGPIVDQLAELIAGIKKDPFGRRHIITAWQPGELDQMALPPCHVLAQFHVSRNSELSCQLYQRSADFFLGVPFNIASYALLTHMIAQVCQLSVGEFIHTTGSAHIYLNHIEQVHEQLKRQPMQLPYLWLNPAVMNIDDFKMEDIKIENYESHPAIKAPMAV
jgi:thymidylate synthase